MPSVEVRAERLRVLHILYGGRPVLTVEEAVQSALGSLTDWDRAVMETVTDDDLRLHAAILTAEAEMRARGYTRLERALGLLPGGDGDLTDRLLALEGDDCRRAARDLLDLGWITITT